MVPLRRFPRSVHYQVQMEYSRPAATSDIGRRPDGRFEVLGADHEDDHGFHHGGGGDGDDASWRFSLPSRRRQTYCDDDRQVSPQLMDSFFHSVDDRLSWSNRRPIHTIYSPRDPKFRTSSPGPIAHRRLSDLHQIQQELSSVLMPSSAERSFPNSTVSSRFTPSSAVFSPSYELPSLRVLHEHLPYIREEEQRYVVNHQFGLPTTEGYYDYPPRPRPYFAPSGTRTARDWRQAIEPPGPTSAGSNMLLPPHIEWRKVPQHQLDVYKRIQELDEQRPYDRRVARVSPSPVPTSYKGPEVIARRESEESVNGSDDRPIAAYTRDRLQEAIGQVRRGRMLHQPQRPFRDAVLDPVPRGPARISHHGNEDRHDDAHGDVNLTIGDGLIAVAPGSRVSVTSVGTTVSSGGGGGGSKQTSGSHFLGDDMQPAGDLEYSPASRSSSSGFASRNTSQSQPSPHQSAQPLPMMVPPPSPPPPPLPPLSSHPMLSTRNLNDLSTDENYEFDADLDAATSVLVGQPPPPPPPEVVDQASFSPRTSKVTKYDDVEIERRIPVLKEEFQQFRRRQLERRHSDEMESEC